MEDNVIQPNKKRKRSEAQDSVVGVLSTESIGRYGEAATEYIKGYTGTVSSDGQVLKKGLRQVSESKINPDYKYQNLKQQAGFSAEIHYVNKENASSIINQDNKRIYRSNDIGRGNDPVYDVLSIDQNGEPSWGAQMKFCGHFDSPEEIEKSARQIVNKLASPSWERYRGTKVLVPQEQYSIAKSYAESTAEHYAKQAELYYSNGDLTTAKTLQAKSDIYFQVADNLQDSGITSKEAFFLREHSLLATAKYVSQPIHMAGLECARSAAIISGSIAIAQNIANIVSGDSTIEEAATDVGTNILDSSISSYLIGCSDTAIRSAMNISSNASAHCLSKTNIPSLIAVSTVQVGKSLMKYASGEIDSLQLVEELGEKGTGVMAASIGATAGSAILPGIGTVFGSIIGYLTSSTIYNSCMLVLAEERLSNERRNRIHAISEAAIESLDAQGKMLRCLIEQHLDDREQLFSDCIHRITSSLSSDDLDTFTCALNDLAAEFGKSLKTSSFDEFNALWDDPSAEFTL